jgi:hypothetical protein
MPSFYNMGRKNAMENNRFFHETAGRINLKHVFIADTADW